MDVRDLKEKLLNKSHVIPFEGKYLIFDCGTCKCIEIDNEVYQALFAEDDLTVTQLKALKELEIVKKSGYFNQVTYDSGNGLDFTIHEIHLGVNTDCNLQCKYCFRHKNIEQSKRISLKKSIKIIDRAIDVFAGDGIDNTWMFFNMGLTGEALLEIENLNKIHEHIIEIENKKKKGINCVFDSTNATMLTCENAKELWKSTHMRNISISIDGPRHIHDQTRVYSNGKGSYDVIKSKIIECNKRYRTTGEVTLTGKMPYVTEIFTCLCNMGFNSICIKPVRINHDNEFAINSSNIENVKDEYTKFVKFLLSKTDSELLNLLSCISERDFLGRFFYRILLGISIDKRCNSLVNLIAIDSDGDMYPCASMMGQKSFKLGNIFDKEGTWLEKRYQLLEKFHLEKKTECVECWALNICGGGCPNSAFVANGNIDKPDYVKCELTRHIIEQAMILLSQIASRKKVFEALISACTNRSPQSVFPISICQYTKMSPVDEGQWNEADVIKLNRKDQFRGYRIFDESIDFSGMLSVLWDSEHLYLRVVYISSEVEDCIELLTDENCIRFSITDSPENMPCEYGIAIESGQPVLYSLRLQDNLKYYIETIKDASVKIKAVKNKIIYTLAVPWKVFGKTPNDEDVYKFNVAIYSREKPFGGKCWYEWSPGIVVENHPALFGNIQFVRK